MRVLPDSERRNLPRSVSGAPKECPLIGASGAPSRYTQPVAVRIFQIALPPSKAHAEDVPPFASRDEPVFGRLRLGLGDHEPTVTTVSPLSYDRREWPCELSSSSRESATRS